MAIPQLSPGVRIREVDLTVGRAENVNPTYAGFAAPFEKGPIEQVYDVETEAELLEVFGKPYTTGNHFEYWLSASSYLAYGGRLRIVRTDDTDLVNANAGVGIASTTTLRIKNYDDYNESFAEATNFTYAAKDPGSWANGVKVCQIDNFADQKIGFNTTDLGRIGGIVGYGLTVGLSSSLALRGSTETFSGYLKGIITGVSTNSVSGNSFVDVKIISRVSSAGTEFQIDYAEGNATASFLAGANAEFINNAGVAVTDSAGITTTAIASAVDWYDQQTLQLDNSTIFWKTIAPKPTTNAFSGFRSGKNDVIHVVVVDDKGEITGNQGTLLEKFTNLSKAKDAISALNSPQRIYYKNFVADNSKYVFAGYNASQANDDYFNTKPVATGFSTHFTPITIGDGLWGLNAQGTTYSAIGNVTYPLVGGKNYDGQEKIGLSTALVSGLSELSTAYDKFLDDSEVDVDFLIMGPGLATKEESQAKANKLIQIADIRRDCIACVSPFRGSVVNITNADTQTANVIDYFSPITSSSYAVLDAGYKYMYDRFNDGFRYVPCNADIAGLMARTVRDTFPWFSPAGQQRGVMLNAIKLAYNPTKAQRDLLYPRRINPVVNQPGIGVLLFGDKTALGYSSAFDRINVRRLFLYVQDALKGAANAQLFEFNDEITRANFVNICEPFLRDVQSKRGLFDFLVICDETNNTPDVIDNNEFRADIFLKPTRSINFVELTFVATRTGVSFGEVAGRV